jgi:hypothetical protein
MTGRARQASSVRDLAGQHNQPFGRGMAVFGPKMDPHKAAMAPAQCSQRPQTEWSADHSAAQAVRSQVNAPAEERMRRGEDS